MGTNSTNSFIPFSSNLIEDLNMCLKTIPGAVCMSTYTITNIIIQLPLCISIIYLGFQRQQSRTPMRHSDFFTYHVVATELMGILGSLVCICGIYKDVLCLAAVGMAIIFCYSFGQMLINILSCGECYLAAVHPIAYLNLQNTKGIRIRNIASAGAWLFSWAVTIVAMTEVRVSFVIFSCVLVCAIVIVSFFCVSVLCVLISSGPGKGGGASLRVDQAKLKAFNVMMAVMGSLMLRFVSNIIMCAILFMPQLGFMDQCIGFFSLAWTCLPSGVLLPLLFLHRAGKLPCIKKPQ